MAVRCCTLHTIEHAGEVCTTEYTNRVALCWFNSDLGIWGESDVPIMSDHEQWRTVGFCEVLELQRYLQQVISGQQSKAVGHHCCCVFGLQGCHARSRSTQLHNWLGKLCCWLHTPVAVSSLSKLKTSSSMCFQSPRVSGCVPLAVFFWLCVSGCVFLAMCLRQCV